MQILKINPENPQGRLINKVVEALNNGGVIAYPTDTVYGIGCDLFNKGAIEKVYQIKGKQRNKPLSFICSDLSDISQYAYVQDYAYKIMKRLLPGPYTFILQATKLVPKIVQTKQKTVGIRVPDNRICFEIVKGLGHPVINTSITHNQDQLFDDPELIRESYGHQLTYIVDGGIIAAEHSSVIDLTGPAPVVLRKGKGDVSMFEEE
ncbi:MAG: threonylcarbamoyl-AMP synthase [Deltaproteobacteria bacterium]|nr:MAG: threonylcarbamoyl-AMP synthase [Deltaproteobacteria bacterium]